MENINGEFIMRACEEDDVEVATTGDIKWCSGLMVMMCTL